MLAAVRRFFSPPVFPGDEEKTIAATMAHYGILFGLVVNLINIPTLILAPIPPLGASSSRRRSSWGCS